MAAVAYLGPNVVESFWTTTDSAGAYQIRGLPAAAYKVAYPAPGNGGRGRIAYQWHGAYDPADSPFVVLGNGDNVALADDELQRVLRVAGADRFETAVQVSRKWGGGVDVFITTGLDFPDALAAGAPAGFLPGSILLISPTSISGSVLTEIARLSPANIWIVGGSAVVPDAAVDRIRQVAVGANFLRLSGSDRYSTATSVANNIGGSNGEPVYVATGTDFPDALVGASAAGYRGGESWSSPTDRA